MDFMERVAVMDEHRANIAVANDLGELEQVHAAPFTSSPSKPHRVRRSVSRWSEANVAWCRTAKR